MELWMLIVHTSTKIGVSMSGLIRSAGSKSGVIGNFYPNEVKITEASFSGSDYVAGTASGGSNVVWKISNIVFLICNTYHAGGAPANNETVCTLPVGYRPDRTVYMGSSTGYQGDTTDVIYCGSNGQIKVGSPNNVSGSTFHLRFTTSFPINIPA